MPAVPVSCTLELEMVERLDELKRTHGLGTRSEAVRLLLTHTLKPEIAQNFSAHTGIISGSKLIMSSITLLTRWIQYECEQRKWDPKRIEQLKEELDLQFAVRE